MRCCPFSGNLSRTRSGRPTGALRWPYWTRSTGFVHYEHPRLPRVPADHTHTLSRKSQRAQPTQTSASEDKLDFNYVARRQQQLSISFTSGCYSAFRNPPFFFYISCIFNLVIRSPDESLEVFCFTAVLSLTIRSSTPQRAQRHWQKQTYIRENDGVVESKVKVAQKRLWKSHELDSCGTAKGFEQKFIQISTVAGRGTNYVFKVMCSKVRETLAGKA